MTNTILLDGEWTLSSLEHPTRKISAALPGDIYTALIAHGLCPDPYYGTNERDVQSFRYEHWIYERRFLVPDTVMASKSLYLELGMVDTFCTVTLNDHEVCECGNAFAFYRPEIKRFLHAGENIIRLAFRPIDEEAAKIAARRGGNYPHSEDCQIKHLNQVRKPICSGGWDWGITLAAYGIYQPIRITGRNTVSIRSIHARQEHQTDCVRVTAIAELMAENDGEESIVFSFNGEKRTIAATLRHGGNEVQACFTVVHPRLWWPNGLGSPELYELTVATAEETQSRKIGLRRIEVVNEPDEYGTSLAFRVNGIDVFAKGADWIPCDAIPSRQTPARYESLLESARLANMNMIRVWGGGQYEKECFYELCDAKGLMVWQDMMFAVSLYPADEAFFSVVRQELEYQIRRLRSHACLVIWCGDNECIGCAKGWLPDEKEQRLANFRKLNAVLASKVAELDDERTFWPSSPCGGPNNFKDGWHNDRDGDMHYWEVWHGGKDFSAYYAVKPRFCTEFGYQSFPSLETVETFCPESERDVLSAVMSHHQKCHLGNKPILDMFAKNFRMPEGFQNFLYLSQVQQALAIKTGVEYWRTLKPRCMGTLFWQFNDNWPVASWSGIEYGGKWKLLQYEARRFYSPAISVILKKDDGSLELHAVSDIPEEVEWELLLECRAMDGTIISSQRIRALLQPNESRLLRQFRDDDFTKLPDNAHFYTLTTCATTRQSRQVMRHENAFFPAPFRDMELPEVTISPEVFKDNEGLCVKLTSDAPAFFVALDAPGLQWAHFSDNNILLLPGASTIIRFTADSPCTQEEVAASLSIRHLRQTY